MTKWWWLWNLKDMAISMWQYIELRNEKLKPLDQKRTGWFLPCTGLAQKAEHKSEKQQKVGKLVLTPQIGPQSLSIICSTGISLKILIVWSLTLSGSLSFSTGAPWKLCHHHTKETKKGKVPKRQKKCADTHSGGMVRQQRFGRYMYVPNLCYGPVIYW